MSDLIEKIAGCIVHAQAGPTMAAVIERVKGSLDCSEV